MMTLHRLALAATLCLPLLALAQASPYAGQQAREIKALSEAERSALLEGQGSGYAKAAELNGYPGPAHVLELAAGLQLSRQQQESTQALLVRHKAAARALGERIVEGERALDAAFASRAADEATVRRLTAEIARLQGELRAEHLRTHLAQTALLRPEQVAAYARLRGYADGGAPAEQHQHHH
jgi:Spy/CpxP family protein refolding chaperone